jgi:glutamine synthetase
MIVLNTIMAQQLIEFKKEVDALLEKEINKDEAIFQVLRSYIVASKDICFEGNGYSQEWVVEAKKRGLNNIASTPDALDAFVSKKSIRLFTEMGVYSERELHARHDINLETYTKKIQIEARTMGDLALNHIIPTAVKYQNVLIQNVKGLKDILSSEEYKKGVDYQLQSIKEISEHISKIKVAVHEMIEERKAANKMTDAKKQAVAYNTKVKAYFDEIRYHADKLELLVDDEMQRDVVR